MRVHIKKITSKGASELGKGTASVTGNAALATFTANVTESINILSALELTGCPGAKEQAAEYSAIAITIVSVGWY